MAGFEVSTVAGARFSSTWAMRRAGSRSCASSPRLVTRTVKDLVARPGITFADRATHTLEGVDGDSQLHAVVG